MTERDIVKKSKWLSKHLRHTPEKIGLIFEEGGWVEVGELLDAARGAGLRLSR